MEVKVFDFNSVRNLFDEFVLVNGIINQIDDEDVVKQIHIDKLVNKVMFGSLEYDRIKKLPVTYTLTKEILIGGCFADDMVLGYYFEAPSFLYSKTPDSIYIDIENSMMYSTGSLFEMNDHPIVSKFLGAVLATAFDSGIAKVNTNN